MGVFRSLSGMIHAELTSADIPGAMAALNGLDIPVFSARQTDEVTVQFSLRRRDYPKLKKLAEKRGESLRGIGREGLYYDICSFARRPVLIAGVCILLFGILYLPSRVLFIRVNGNDQIPEKRILEAAAQCGIRFGASRREVRSERVKNALLEAVPELQWAGVNTSGCTAAISVRERSLNNQEERTGVASSMTAVRDGVITACTATKGNLVCAPGQAVKAGQLLISGYTDCGLSIRFTGAEGEVYARTMHKIQAKMPVSYRTRGEETDRKHVISLLVGKKRINLWKDSGIWDTTCGRIYSEYYVTLPGGFALPLAIAVETYAYGTWESAETAEEVAVQHLQEAAPRYLLGQMIAGQILSQAQQVSVAEGAYVLTGEYVCTEMIGRVQREQMGDHNGENR